MKVFGDRQRFVDTIRPAHDAHQIGFKQYADFRVVEPVFAGDLETFDRRLFCGDVVSLPERRQSKILTRFCPSKRPISLIELTGHNPRRTRGLWNIVRIVIGVVEGYPPG
ncbi:MAG: hypothetical protein AAFY22_12810 [Pseudomonadota bacterium]